MEQNNSSNNYLFEFVFLDDKLLRVAIPSKLDDELDKTFLNSEVSIEIKYNVDDNDDGLRMDTRGYLYAFNFENESLRAREGKISIPNKLVNEILEISKMPKETRDEKMTELLKDSSLRNCIKNYDKVYSAFEKKETEKTAENSDNYLKNKDSILKADLEINRLVDDIAEKSKGKDYYCKDGVYGMDLKTGEKVHFVKFQGKEFYELKNARDEKYELNKNAIRFLNATYKDFRKDEIDKKLAKISLLKKDIETAKKNIEKINLADTRVSKIEISKKSGRVYFESDVVLENKFDLNTFDELTENNVDEFYEKVTKDKDFACNYSEDKMKEYFCSEESIEYMSENCEETEYGKYVGCSATENKDIIEHKFEKGKAVIDFTDKNDIKFIYYKLDENNNYKVDISSNVPKDFFSQSFKNFKVESKNENKIEGLYDKFEKTTSPLSYVNSERISLKNEGHNIEINKFRTKYGDYYEIVDGDGKGFSTTSVDELKKVLDGINDGKFECYDQHNKTELSNTSLATKLEVVDEKMRVIGRRNGGNNTKLRLEKVLIRCLTVYGDNSKTLEEKVSCCEDIIDKETFILSEDERKYVYDEIEKYKEVWKDSNEKENQEAKIDILFKNDYDENYKGDSIGVTDAKMRLAYDNGKKDFHINSVYFDKNSYEFRTGYTYFDKGKKYVEFNNSNLFINDVTSSENFEDVSRFISQKDTSFKSLIENIGFKTKDNLDENQNKLLKDFEKRFNSVFDNKDKPFDTNTRMTTVQGVINLVNRNSEIMKLLYVSEKQEGKNDADWDESKNNLMDAYEKERSEYNNIDATGSIETDIYKMDNIASRIQEAQTGKEANLNALKEVHKNEQISKRVWSIYYYPVTFSLIFPIFLASGLVGRKVKICDPVTGKIESVKIKLTPLELFKTHPICYDPSNTKMYQNLRKGYYEEKAYEKYYKQKQEKMEALYGSPEVAKQCFELKNKINELGVELKNSYDKCLDKIVDLDNKNIQINNDLLKIDKNIDSLNSKIDELSKKISNLDKKDQSENTKKEKEELLKEKDCLLERKKDNLKEKDKLTKKSEKNTQEKDNTEKVKDRLSSNLEKFKLMTKKFDSCPKDNLESVKNEKEELDKKVEKLKECFEGKDTIDSYDKEFEERGSEERRKDDIDGNTEKKDESGDKYNSEKKASDDKAESKKEDNKDGAEKKSFENMSSNDKPENNETETKIEDGKENVSEKEDLRSDADNFSNKDKNESVNKKSESKEKFTDSKLSDDNLKDIDVSEKKLEEKETDEKNIKGDILNEKSEILNAQNEKKVAKAIENFTKIHESNSLNVFSSVECNKSKIDGCVDVKIEYKNGSAKIEGVSETGKMSKTTSEITINDTEKKVNYELKIRPVSSSTDSIGADSKIAEIFNSFDDYGVVKSNSPNDCLKSAVENTNISSVSLDKITVKGEGEFEDKTFFVPKDSINIKGCLSEIKDFFENIGGTILGSIISAIASFFKAKMEKSLISDSIEASNETNSDKKIFEEIKDFVEENNIESSETDDISNDDKFEN